MKQTHIPYGFITGIIMVVIGLVLYLTGLAFKPGLQYIAQIPFLVGIILNAMAFSKANDGFVTFGNVFGSGFKMSMIVALVMVAWAAISLFALPEMKVKAMEAAREAIDKNPKVTDDQAEMSMNMMGKFFAPIMIATSIFGALLYGAVFSLIGAAVARKKGNNPFAGEIGS